MERGNLVVALNSRLQRLDGVLEPLQPDVQRAEVVERPHIRAIEHDRALVGRDGGIRLAQRFERTALKPQRLTRSRIERDRPPSKPIIRACRSPTGSWAGSRCTS